MANAILENRSSGEKFYLSARENTIGRVQGNTVVIPSGSVSKIHAKIFVLNSSLYISDLGSTNGTFVNGRKLERGMEYPLQNESVIGFGNTESFVIHIEDMGYIANEPDSMESDAATVSVEDYSDMRPMGGNRPQYGQNPYQSYSAAAQRPEEFRSQPAQGGYPYGSAPNMQTPNPQPQPAKPQYQAPGYKVPQYQPPAQKTQPIQPSSVNAAPMGLPKSASTAVLVCSIVIFVMLALGAAAAVISGAYLDLICVAALLGLTIFMLISKKPLAAIILTAVSGVLEIFNLVMSVLSGHITGIANIAVLAAAVVSLVLLIKANKR